MLINQLFESTYSQYDKPTYLRNNPKEPTKKSSWTGVDMEVPAYKRKEQAELEKKRLNKEGYDSREAYKTANPHPASRDPIVAKVLKQMRPGLTGIDMNNEAFLYFAYELGKQRARNSWEYYGPAIKHFYQSGIGVNEASDRERAEHRKEALAQWKEDHFGSSKGFEEHYGNDLDYQDLAQKRWDDDTQDVYEGDSTVDAEKKQVIRALKNEWQFDRKRHGSLFDRGSADSYYSRSRDPHYGGVGGDSGNRVKVTDAESIAEYLAGFQDNEENGDRKDYS